MGLLKEQRKHALFLRSLNLTAIVFLIGLVIIRVTREFRSYISESLLLRVEAKCPGLPYGQNSGGPDYINIALDAGLVAAAAFLVYLTVRDMRRKRRMRSSMEKQE